jgi:hypothetical protein
MKAYANFRCGAAILLLPEIQEHGKNARRGRPRNDFKRREIDPG